MDLGKRGGGMNRSSRVKIVSMDEQLLVDVLNLCRDRRPFISLPITDELPEDATVRRAFVNYERRTIDLIIESESFDEVPDGAMPPRVSQMVETFRVVETEVTE
jgi:hypothetical protein